MLRETSAFRTTAASTSIGASAAPAPQPADRRERQNDGRNSEANPQEAHRSAAAEIRSVAKSDPVAAGDGVVSLMERIWPAFQGIYTSSKALGAAVLRTMNELIPILTVVSADQQPEASGSRDCSRRCKATASNIWLRSKIAGARSPNTRT